ncbi:MAG: 50S ribosomal protein L5 [Ignavibacteriales bacterium]|nr:50S ribosomal protein L5 [Ignavibacteriales bacterium]
MGKEKEKDKEQQKKPEGGKGKEQKQAKGSGDGGGKKPAAAGREAGVPARLFVLYKKEIIPQLMKKFQYKSVMQVPKLVKISVNSGVGMATQDPKVLDVTVKELEFITGQKVAVTKSKKAISNFKLREGLAIGCRVTLRRAQMYEFIDRLINIALPRVRDFRGVSDKSFDGHGNYTLGIKEQIIFPEIDTDKVTRISGMDVTFVTTAKTDAEAYELLKALGMPFVKRQEVLQTAA